MVIANLDIECIAVDESKTDSPSFVDRNRMLALAIIFQVMQPVAWRDLEVAENSCSVDLFELA